MPIDASIPLGVRPVELPNQLAQFGQIAQIQGLQQRNRLAELQFAQAEREQAKELAIGDAYRTNVNPDGTLNRQGLIGGLASAGQGAAIPGIQKTFSEQDKATREAEKARLEQAGQQIGLIGQVAGSAKDQASYSAGLQQLAAAGIDTSQIPAQFDPAYVQQARQQALTAAQQLEQQWKAKEFDLDNQKFGYQQVNDAANRNVSIRGQDLSASTAIRGQNMTDARSRESTAATREAAATGRAPSGYRWTADGSALEPIPGGPGMKDKAPTEFQGKSASFGARMQQADKIIGSLEGQYSPTAVNAQGSASRIPVVGGVLGTIGNMALPQNEQLAKQAQTDFLTAALRLESGAVIGPTEFATGREQYFPQPGDSAAVLKQKAANRKLAINGFLDNAGPAFKGDRAAAAAPERVPSNTSSGRINGGPSTGSTGGWSVKRLD